MGAGRAASAGFSGFSVFFHSWGEKLYFFGGCCMVYTPQISVGSSVSVRRLAWYLDLPMTKTLDEVVSKLPSLFPAGYVCGKCRDTKRCAECVFKVKAEATAQEAAR
jgi:hypothetical protein